MFEPSKSYQTPQTHVFMEKTFKSFLVSWNTKADKKYGIWVNIYYSKRHSVITLPETPLFLWTSSCSCGFLKQFWKHSMWVSLWGTINNVLTPLPSVTQRKTGSPRYYGVSPPPCTGLSMWDHCLFCSQTDHWFRALISQDSLNEDTHKRILLRLLQKVAPKAMSVSWSKGEHTDSN